jgi:TolB protein
MPGPGALDASRQDGNSKIFVVSSDGSGTPIDPTRHPSDDSSPAWEPGGNRIAFSSDRGGDFDLWAMSDTGADPVRLLDSPQNDTAPAWSK